MSVWYRRHGYMIIIYACMCVCLWCMCECGCVCNMLYGSLTRLSWLVCGLIKAQRPSWKLSQTLVTLEQKPKIKLGSPGRHLSMYCIHHNTTTTNCLQESVCHSYIQGFTMSYYYYFACHHHYYWYNVNLYTHVQYIYAVRMSPYYTQYSCKRIK